MAKKKDKWLYAFIFGLLSGMGIGLFSTYFLSVKPIKAELTTTKLYLFEKQYEKNHWQDEAEKLSSAFAGSEKDFVEMQDYAWKLERRLKKCESR